MEKKILSFTDTRKAAEEGAAEAQFNLGLLYRSGEGVSQDDTEAMIWFLKAAQQ